MCIKIGDIKVGPGNPCFFIAEIGINHNGSLDLAKDLVSAAKCAGAQAVKFQKRTVNVVYKADELAQKRAVHPSIIKNALERRIIEGIEYPVFPPENLSRLSKDVPCETTNGDLKYALEFGQKEYDVINTHCLKEGLYWSASSWDGHSAHFINGFEDVQWLKIASACLTHVDLLKRVLVKKKPIILSTGGSTLDQIKHAVEILSGADLALLHCVAEYPPDDSHLNLNVIKTLARAFPGIPIGYSSHSTDTLGAVAAVAMGTSIVEAHLTLDKDLPGSDHKASLTPDQFKDMVMNCRRVEEMRGDGIKKVYPGEVITMNKLRRIDDLSSEVALQS